MTDPDYIVALAGGKEAWDRAGRYNVRRSLLSDLKAELARVRDWNSRERHGSGWFAQTKPPIDPVPLMERISALTIELTAEREAIDVLSNHSIRPGL